jgi:LasA protease
MPAPAARSKHALFAPIKILEDRKGQVCKNLMHFHTDHPPTSHRSTHRPANCHGAAWFERLVPEQGQVLVRILLGIACAAGFFLLVRAWAIPQAVNAAPAAYNFRETPSGPDLPGSALFRYTVQSGDSLPVVAARFGVPADQIRASSGRLFATGFLSPGQTLLIPVNAMEWPAARHLLPDSEVVYGPNAAAFDLGAYLRQAGGILGTWHEYLPSTEMTPAPDIIERVALENSINPRLLLTLLEYSCSCVLEKPAKTPQDGLWLGTLPGGYRGLYGQLSWAANQLSVGYYGWRSGTFADSLAPGDIIQQLSPLENAGSVALQMYFAALLSSQARPGQEPDWQTWERALDPQSGFPALYARMFGDPRQRALLSGPLLPADLQQPALILPFDAGWLWSYTSGPHPAWDTQSVYAALDFAPASTQSGCAPSQAWVTAVANGVVVRAGFGAIVQDLDLPDGQLADGLEQTGWDILYLHVDPGGSVPVGTHLHSGDRIGHPSCAGGRATGTHLHIARKYNGEWLAADGPLPFNLEGWIAHAGDKPYSGTLQRAGEVVTANPYGIRQTYIWRETLVEYTRIWIPILVEK